MQKRAWNSITARWRKYAVGKHLGGSVLVFGAATGAEYDPTTRTMAKSVAGARWDQGPISWAGKKLRFFGEKLAVYTAGTSPFHITLISPVNEV